MAIANSASTVCATPIRLERIIIAPLWGASHLQSEFSTPSSWHAAVEDDLLVGCRDVHVQLLLGDGLQSGAARGIADHRSQSHAVGVERGPPLLKPSDLRLPLNAQHSACNDARR